MVNQQKMNADDFSLSTDFLKENEKQNQSRFLLITLFTTLGISIVYLILSELVMKFDVGVYVCAYFIVVHVLLFLLLKIKAPYYIIGNLFAFLILSGLTVIALYSGGITAPVIAWFLCAIVSAFWYANRLSGIIWAVFTVLDVLIIFLLDYHDIVVKNLMPDSSYDFYAGVMYTGVIVYYLIVVFTYENWKQKASVALNDQHKTLLSNHEELTQQNEEIIAQREMLSEKTDLLENVNNKLNSSIRYASRIQQSLLESEEYFKELVQDGFIFWEPRDVVGGDFYWMHDYGNGVKTIACIDCTGHGVPGAFLTIMANDILSGAASLLKISDPRHLLIYLNQNVVKLTSKNTTTVEDGMDVSIIKIDDRKQELEFAGAKQNLYLVNDSGLTEYKGGKFSIGGQLIKDKRFDSIKVPYQKGDCIYLQSDGYQDQFGGVKNTKFLKKKYKQQLASFAGYTMQEQKEKLADNFLQWKENEKQTDDVLVIGIQL
ncbi:SpoIIE family protein phosphatase [Flammeovirga sp. SubArs3]|uniref:PP2C family protein-serine/threonine phosphatase n=1 Tax=Flammeovirga sp. SubArs3 TaxID=2995316 RepID=UPI00248B18D4|nr:SpoIIE family protein phosphatase [Flammeovirga sp. SubArs3]